MTNVIGVILVVLVLYRLVKQRIGTALAETTKYSLLGLRDKLRMMEIDGQVNSEAPIVHFVDMSISRSAERLEFCNAWLSLYLYLRHRRVPTYLDEHKRTEAIIASERNLHPIFEEYNDILWKYSLKKDACSLAIFALVYTGYRAIKDHTLQNLTEKLQNTRTYSKGSILHGMRA